MLSHEDGKKVSVGYEKLLVLKLQKYGAIDVFVSNAAVNPALGIKILEAQESVLDKLWEVNVKSSILIIQV